MLDRNVRSFLCEDYYMDVDLKKCHWYILDWLFRKYKINPPLIEELLNVYKTIEEELTQEGGLEAKKALLALVNTQESALSEKSFEILLTYDILRELHFCIYVDLYPLLIKEPKYLRLFELCASDTYNPAGKFIAMMLQTIECTIMSNVIKQLRLKGIEVGGFIYDGCHVAKRDIDKINRFINEPLKIKDMKGYNGLLVVKPFQTHTFVDYVEPPKQQYHYPMSKHMTHSYEGYLPTDEFKAIIESSDITFIKMVMGSGKSYTTMNYAQHSGLNYFVISHRISLDDNLCRTFGLESYRSNESIENSNKPYSVCINSLDKVLMAKNKCVNDYDIIIIDEIRSVMLQTEMKDMVQNTHRLIDILQNFEGKLIVMDANMTDADIEFIKGIRDETFNIPVEAPPQYAVIESIKTAPQFDMELEIAPSTKSIQYGGTMDKLIHHDFTDSKVILCTNFGIHTKNPTLIALIQSSDLKVIHINKDTINDVDLSTENLIQYDIIIQSPTISEGVSFDSPLFSNHILYGLFNNKTCSPETCLQMTRRWRSIKTYRVCLGIDMNTSRYSTEEEYYTFASTHTHTVSTYLTRAQVYNPTKRGFDFKIRKDNFWNLHCKNMLEKEYQMSHFEDVFTEKAVDNLFNVTRVFGCGSLDSETYNTAAEYFRDIHFTKVSEAPLIGDDDFERLKSTQCSYPNTLLQEKYTIHNATNLMEQETMDCSAFYEYWSSAPTRTAIHNLRRLFRINRDNNGLLAHSPIKDIIDELIVKETRVVTSHNNVLVLKSAILIVIERILSGLGFTFPANEGVDIHQYYLNYNKTIGSLKKWELYKLDRELKINVSGAKNKLGSILKLIGLGTVQIGNQMYLNCVLEDVALVNPKCIDSDAKPRASITDLMVFNPDDLLFVERYNTMFLNTKEKVDCMYCKKSIQLKSYYASHLKSKGHLRKVDDFNKRTNLRYECLNCKVECANRTELDGHKCDVEFTGGGGVGCGEGGIVTVARYVCKMCHKNFGNHKGHFESHIKSCGKSVEYRCGKCDKDFGNHKGHFESHIRSCGKSVDYNCEGCGKGFGNRKSDYKRHMKSCGK